jgi:Low specificity phosphatase (HAD superfamily)
MTAQLHKKMVVNRKYAMLHNAELIVYDFDGVMTDNKVILREDGTESVVVNRSDGLAVSIIKVSGISQLILTTEKNKVVDKRAKKLGIPLIQGVSDKKRALLDYCVKNNVLLSRVVYVGNDINDLDAMLSVGYPVCPMDAAAEIKKISVIIISATGGNGVVRELLRYIDAASTRSRK